MSKNVDFRETFGRLHDDVLINLGEFAVVAGSTRAGMYKALERHPKALPAPIRMSSGKHAPIRFRVGDVRQWIREKAGVCESLDLPAGGDAEAKADQLHSARKPVGRRRVSVDVPGLRLGGRT